MRRTAWVAPVLVAAGLMVVFIASRISPQSPPSKPGVSITASPLFLATQAHQVSPTPPIHTATASPTQAQTVPPIQTTPFLPAPLPTLTPTLVNLIPLPATLSGVVVSTDGPLAGAIVQIHGSPKQTTTAKDGAYVFTGISGTTPIVLTAWYAGYYIGSASVNPSAPDWKGGQNLTIKMTPYDTNDNNKYTWFTFNGVSGSAACGLCHREYPEWQADAHSQGASNPRFISMYTGADVKGNRGQPTQFGTDGKILPADPSQPYYGPGFKLDNPSRAGNCATCHTPLASQSPNNQNCSWSGCHTNLTVENSRGIIPPVANPVSLRGVAAEGINCDFCHKIGDVTIDPKTNLPPPDMPGILSLRLYRPQDGQQIFFGTLIDVPRRDTYLPLLTESKYCAACHYGVFGGVVGMGTVTGGTVIYDSYGEWLKSPYSDPKTGQSCQQCHMPVSSAKWFVTSGQGGLTRDYAPLHDHTMPGITDTKLLQNAVSMKSAAQREGSQVTAQISITNDNTGHDIPTDSPLRSMILVVEAFDENGKPLALSDGPVNPAFSGNYGGLPGKTFAKVLKDELSGEAPTASYWRTVSIQSDNRLAPYATDTTRYTFAAPEGTKVTLKVHLIYRRAFQELSQQKGWNDPDIVMKEDTLTIAAK